MPGGCARVEHRRMGLLLPEVHGGATKKARQNAHLPPTTCSMAQKALQIRENCISLGRKNSSHNRSGRVPGRWATHGALADMGETAEFEKLNTLEARLAAALDRIAAGLGAAVAMAPLQDPGITSGEMEEAMIRAQTAEARLAELEAQLSAPQASDGELSALAAERDGARAQLDAQDAAHQAYRDETTRALAARDAELAQLQAALAQAQVQAQVQDEAHAAAQAEAQAAAQAIAEAQAAAQAAEQALAQAAAQATAEAEAAALGDTTPPPQDDAAVMAMRDEIKDLQQINARLIKNINRLRSEAASDPAVLNKTLVVELDALRALRASEAAELERILADLDGTEMMEGADA